MSVINKMLRDLDQRQAQPDPTAASRSAQPLRSTASLAAPEPTAFTPPSRFAYGAAVLFVLAVSVVAWVWWGQSQEARVASVATPPPVAPAAPALAAVSAQPPLAGPATPASAPTLASAPVAIASPMVRPAASSAAPMGATQKTVPAAAPFPAASMATTTAKQPVSASPAAFSKPATAVVTPTGLATGTAPAAPAPAVTNAAATATTATTSPEPQTNPARQLQAGREALAQAQALWAAGSHDAATDLLQQAVGLTERAGVGTPASQQLLSALVRELARMWLADGRTAASLELLTRHEQALARDADVWALRGNAAQRLGRHPESVRAYTAALQQRPNEGRWLLGSAVSLAALGQTAQATELAAKARAQGPISKEVQAYLRQAGVQLSEP